MQKIEKVQEEMGGGGEKGKKNCKGGVKNQKKELNEKKRKDIINQVKGFDYKVKGQGEGWNDQVQDKDACNQRNEFR